MLAEVAMIYSELDERKRLDCTLDIQKIIKQTLISLKLNYTNVVLQGIKLLESIAVHHSSIFLQELPIIFAQLKVSSDLLFI